MTLDKIKFYMGDFLYSHWCEVANSGNVQAIKNGKEKLEKGMGNGSIPNEIKYVSELKLLNYLLQ